VWQVPQLGLHNKKNTPQWPLGSDGRQDTRKVQSLSFNLYPPSTLSIHFSLFHEDPYIILNINEIRPIISGSLSPRRGVPWGCGRMSSLQIWRAAVNLFNKQKRRNEKGWSSNLGVGRGLKTPHHKNTRVAKCYTEPMICAARLTRFGWSNAGQWNGGGACDMCGGEEKYVRGFGGETWRREPLGRYKLRLEVILKWIL